MKRILIFIYSVLFSIIANSYVLLVNDLKILFIIIPVFLLINAFAGMFCVKTDNRRLKMCNHGASLLVIFVTSTCVSVVYHMVT